MHSAGTLSAYAPLTPCCLSWQPELRFRVLHIPAAAAAANNGLVGTLPDVYDDTSPLQYLSLRNNKLSGTIPATLGVAGDLQVLHFRVRVLVVCMCVLHLSSHARRQLWACRTACSVW